MAKNKYYLNESGISALVKSIVKNLFESTNYINLQKTLSSLREDIDKVTTSSNEIVPCRCASRNNGRYECLYPDGFNANNTMIVGTYSSYFINGSPGQFAIEYVQFSFTEFYIQASTSFYNPGGDVYVYLMKKPSA